MTEAATQQRPPASGRRCRARPRQADELRPTDVVGAFFLLGITMIIVGAAAGLLNAVDPWPQGRWLALHLIFVGGISQLVLGASQFFAGAFLATDPPSRGSIRAQLIGWNLGAILLAVAYPLGSDALVWVAAAILLATLAGYALSLRQMRLRSLQSAPWAVRWYLAAAGLLAVGVLAGALLAAGIRWGSGNLLGAHMALNVGGWFGVAIVGTLHTFYPSLTKTMLGLPRLQAPTFIAWVGGVVALAIGYGWSIEPLATSGWLALTASAALLLVNIAASLRVAPRPLSLSARMIGLAQVFLLAGLLVAAVGAIGSGPSEVVSGSLRAAVGTLLVAGWVGVTVAGSLLHLLAVVVRVRDFSRPMPEPRPRADIALTVAVALGVSTLVVAQVAELDDLRELAVGALVATYLVVALRILTLGSRVLAVARPRV